MVMEAKEVTHIFYLFELFGTSAVNGSMVYEREWVSLT